MADNYDKTTLSHYGILGQKWGERRYQNPDGTYTEEGLRRKRGNKKPLSDKAKKALKIGAATAGAAALAYGVYKHDSSRPVLNKMQVHKLTDDALDKLVDRLEKEKKVADKQNELYPSTALYIGDILSKIGNKSLVQIGTSAAVVMGINFLNEYLDDIKKPTPKDKW